MFAAYGPEPIALDHRGRRGGGAGGGLGVLPAPSEAGSAGACSPAARPRRSSPRRPCRPAQKTDAEGRKQLAALSSRPEWAQWLATSDLLDRWVVVVDNVAEDVSPRRQLDFIKVTPQGNAPRLDYARYDGVADVIASVDAKGFAQVVRELHPLVVTAYHKLGYPDRKFDDVLAKALQRVVDAPVLAQPPKLEPKGANFRFSRREAGVAGAGGKAPAPDGPAQHQARAGEGPRSRGRARPAHRRALSGDDALCRLVRRGDTCATAGRSSRAQLGA